MSEYLDEVSQGPHDPRFPTGWREADSFHEALKAAWTEARRDGAPNSVRIVNIYVTGENPIRGYKIDFD